MIKLRVSEIIEAVKSSQISEGVKEVQLVHQLFELIVSKLTIIAQKCANLLAHLCTFCLLVGSIKMINNYLNEIFESCLQFINRDWSISLLSKY